MGSNFANDLANYDLGLDLSSAISIHLSANHYPPVPQSMVLPCIEAIEAYHELDSDREIAMPEGVSYRGRNTAPAWAIIEQHHLEAWLYNDEEE
jgi:hypothetical protein